MNTRLRKLLAGLPDRRQIEYLQLSDELQVEIVNYILEEGKIPHFRKFGSLFGPDAAVEVSRIVRGDKDDWMAR